MRVRVLCVAAILAVACAGSSLAELMGSAYEGTVTTSDSDLLVSPGGGNPYTDLTNPFTFCVTGQGQASCGLYGSVTLTDVDATEADITFEFTGSASATPGDTFTVDLSDFITPDGSRIGSLDPTTDSLADGSFQLTSFNSGDAVFTGTAGSDGLIGAGAGQAVVFDDGLILSPEPGSIFLFGTGLAVLFFATKRRRASQRGF